MTTQISFLSQTNNNKIFQALHDDVPENKTTFQPLRLCLLDAVDDIGR